MVNENLKLITENKKPIETVYEIKNEIPSFEEFMKTYENDSNLNYGDLDSGSVGEVKGYGPCQNYSCDCHIRFTLSPHGTIGDYFETSDRNWEPSYTLNLWDKTSAWSINSYKYSRIVSVKSLDSLKKLLLDVEKDNIMAHGENSEMLRQDTQIAWKNKIRELIRKAERGEKIGGNYNID